MEHLDSSPITSSQIRLWTDKDPVLAKIKGWILTGWPENSPSDEKLHAYLSRKSELSVEDGCLLWGNRVILPEKGRKRVVTMLHQAHPRISRMKGLVRCYVWWPGIDKDLELCIKSCEACQTYPKSPPSVRLHPWSWPGKPWLRVHIDYAGPFMGKMFLLVIDEYTKWLDVHVTSTSTSTATIKLLRKLFSTYGLPKLVVSDNATNFTSDEFEAFLKANGVKHVRTPPHHPASNRLVEHAMQTFKNGIKKLKTESVETKVSQFLFAYRASLGELKFGRHMHTAMDNIRPDLDKKVRQR